MDKTYWNRVLTNLLKNALQAIPSDRTPSICICIEKVESKIIVTVSDNGVGIDGNINVFKPSFTTKTSGMGLGLAMTKKMIEEYKGSITFFNNKKQGCTFVFKLPI